MNCATLQFVVAVAIGVLVEAGEGMGVNVAGIGSGVKLGVTMLETGVALSNASTVCAAAVLAVSSIFLDGRLQALINKAIMINRLKKLVLFFISILLH
jgi:hypothetical protein